MSQEPEQGQEADQVKNQESEQENAKQFEHIVQVVTLLRHQVETLSELAYDMLTKKPETVEEWNEYVHRYNLIEATNQTGEKQ